MTTEPQGDPNIVDNIDPSRPNTVVLQEGFAAIFVNSTKCPLLDIDPE
jgi:hypothetical protein